MRSFTAVTFVAIGALASSVAASPAATTTTTSQPATVTFSPYKLTGCRMSDNPKDPQNPTTYTLTTGSGCVTPSYAFISYVESANSLAASGPCSLSIFTGAGCTGTAKTGVITTFGQCVTDSNASGKSVRLACGP